MGYFAGRTGEDEPKQNTTMLGKLASFLTPSPGAKQRNAAGDFDALDISKKKKQQRPRRRRLRHRGGEAENIDIPRALQTSTTASKFEKEADEEHRMSTTSDDEDKGNADGPETNGADAPDFEFNASATAGGAGSAGSVVTEEPTAMLSTDPPSASGGQSTSAASDGGKEGLEEGRDDGQGGDTDGHASDEGQEDVVGGQSETRGDVTVAGTTGNNSTVEAKTFGAEVDVAGEDKVGREGEEDSVGTKQPTEATGAPTDGDGGHDGVADEGARDADKGGPNEEDENKEDGWEWGGEEDAGAGENEGGGGTGGSGSDPEPGLSAIYTEAPASGFQGEMVVPSSNSTVKAEVLEARNGDEPRDSENNLGGTEAVEREEVEEESGQGDEDVAVVSSALQTGAPTTNILEGNVTTVVGSSSNSTSMAAEAGVGDGEDGGDEGNADSGDGGRFWTKKEEEEEDGRENEEDPEEGNARDAATVQFSVASGSSDANFQENVTALRSNSTAVEETSAAAGGERDDEEEEEEGQKDEISQEGGQERTSLPVVTGGDSGSPSSPSFVAQNESAATAEHSTGGRQKEGTIGWDIAVTMSPINVEESGSSSSSSRNSTSNTFDAGQQAEVQSPTEEPDKSGGGWDWAGEDIEQETQQEEAKVAGDDDGPSSSASGGGSDGYEDNKGAITPTLVSEHEGAPWGSREENFVIEEKYEEENAEGGRAADGENGGPTQGFMPGSHAATAGEAASYAAGHQQLAQTPAATELPKERLVNNGEGDEEGSKGGDAGEGEEGTRNDEAQESDPQASPSGAGNVDPPVDLPGQRGNETEEEGSAGGGGEEVEEKGKKANGDPCQYDADCAGELMVCRGNTDGASGSGSGKETGVEGGGPKVCACAETNRSGLWCEAVDSCAEYQSCDACRDATKMTQDLQCAWTDADKYADDGRCVPALDGPPFEEAFAACLVPSPPITAGGGPDSPYGAAAEPPPMWWAAGVPLVLIVLCGGVLVIAARLVKKCMGGHATGPDYTL